MKYVLTVYLQDKEGVKSKSIGEYDSLKEAKLRQDELFKKGYFYDVIRESDANDYYFYPPFSIVKFHILTKLED